MAMVATRTRYALSLPGWLVLGLALLLAMPRLVRAPVVLADAPVAAPSKAAEPVEVTKQTPSRSKSQWLDEVAEFFRHPLVNIALIAVGLIGLIFEFKLPGTTFPGSVAAVCFVLFFWAYSFVGQFTLLAILLFLLGLVFLGVEIFIVPGLGFSGVAGAVLLFVSLLLVTLDHWPENQDDWTNLGATFGTFAIGLALAIAGALALTWSLPSLPVLHRMVLKPSTEESVALAQSKSGALELLGAIGVAVTPLRPAGKAQFGEQFLDVMAEGEYVAPGSRVHVVEIEGRRIVVKEL